MERDLLAAARRLLEGNTQREEKDGRTFLFSVPSPKTYPFQWFWDSCFHAIVWSHFDLDRAKDELRSLLAWQRRDGFIPHIIFWNTRLARRWPWTWHHHQSGVLPGRRPKTTARIQPPVLAQAVERIVDRDSDGGFLDETLEPLARYYRYLAASRDPDRDDLISLISRFESGLDFSPVYDHPYRIEFAEDREPVVEPRWHTRREVLNKALPNRPARIARVGRHHQEDVLLNSVYAQGLTSLTRLAELGNDRQLAAWAAEKAERVTQALVAKCFDPELGLFFNLAGPREEPVRIKSILSLLPLILPALPGHIFATLLERLIDPDEFWLPYPVPSVARSESSFRPDRTWLIWRGPLSMNTNWFLLRGLRLHGRADVAHEIAARSRELVLRHGFNEFYNPLSGEPVGAETFGWATLVVDLEDGAAHAA